MKLIIQIPCLNEAESLPATLASLPKQVTYFDTVEWLVIDDGSTDNTSEVAHQSGVDHVLRLPHNQGLAKAFMAGLEESLRQGADVIVNTDADNQYDASCIPDLVAPIMSGEAQIVIGARPIEEIAHFSPLKRRLQRLGSFAVRLASGTSIPDAASGFRAFHRDAAMQLYVFNPFTYTLETIIQAGRKYIPITSVPVRVNGPTRPSRLFRSTPVYIWQSIKTTLRIATLYRPLRTLSWVALFMALPGVIAILRFLFLYVSGDGRGHIQSLAIAGTLLSIAAIIAMGGLIADLVAANRRLLEDIRSRLLRGEIERASSVKRDAQVRSPST
ncbi:glycosyltransferase family 2 protein [Oricola cellulosilytica]|uniref:Glycosyltransferase family 2 protein n=1 Tax=Oricola cellulosilytica TaxID=1429082 RepID=A0A4R0PKV9_9HYPH|nr:glycosyltransferase family 2 protein [Oricola cellulosilytica]TCD16169.1 glycosyltransferase family 2 protein [Oricola cellulosilytica]